MPDKPDEEIRKSIKRFEESLPESERNPDAQKYIYTENIYIYSRLVVIYRIILYYQSLLALIIRSFDLSCKSLEHKTWKAASKTPRPGA
jgi:hypothetical protein